MSAFAICKHDRMASLAERMLKLHKDLPKARTPHEQESLQRQIAAADNQIDALALICTD